MREFVTAAEEAVANQDDDANFGRDTVIKVDGREVRIMAVSEGALAMLLASDSMPLHQRISASVNFFFAMLRDGEDDSYFKSRLFDRKDSFGGSQIADIVEGVIEEWTGDPTQSSSDSTGSLDSTGESSTDTSPPKASTRSRSRQGASAT